MPIKIDTEKLTLLPVPEGLRIKYTHHYSTETIPKRLASTSARLIDAEGTLVWGAQACVSKKDTPIKKLGRVIAHNRCIKNYLKTIKG